MLYHCGLGHDKQHLAKKKHVTRTKFKREIMPVCVGQLSGPGIQILLDNLTRSSLVVSHILRNHN